MPRAFMPGRWARDLSRAIPDNACTGNCNQGRACTCDTELANVVPLRPAVPIQPAITVHRVPLRRRMARSFKALWSFLKRPTFF